MEKDWKNGESYADHLYEGLIISKRCISKVVSKLMESRFIQYSLIYYFIVL